ncbi:MAG: all-trans-retinol 13,14-reductase [Flavobacteriales bacterium]|jgi:all-trans-retinol 13,14-reductase
MYDVAIIGAGLGGLQCAYILAKEGYKVIVLEKNHQLGGSLQVFSRDKTVFDTGVHYIGGLDKGQNLNQYFRYFGLLEKIKLRKMDERAFDRVHFGDGDEYYNHAQGYDLFIEEIVRQFPKERAAVTQYCDKVRAVCDRFPLYNLEVTEPDYFSDTLLELSAYEYINSLSTDKVFCSVLAGTNALYAGVKEKTPFYIHALVVNTYIESSYRLVDGGSQIAKHLARAIHSMGGEIRKRAEVVGSDVVNREIKALHLSNGDVIEAKQFISNAHPITTFNLIGPENFKKAYRNRIMGLENTISSFTLHLSFKEKSFPYLDYNIYHYDKMDVWGGMNYTEKTWPGCYMLSCPANSKTPDYADGLSVMAYMHYDEMKPWAKSYNTVARPDGRVDSYEDFKQKKSEVLLDAIDRSVFPGIKEKVNGVYASTPLTFRDYIGSPDGNMYGVLNDHNSFLKTFINPKTKVSNLYLTGQNIGVHGILGVTVSSLITCFEFVDRDKLMKDIKSA